MTRAIRILGVAGLLSAMLALGYPQVQAGRAGGPQVIVGVVPAGTSVFYDMPFEAGSPAIVSVAGNGASQLFVLLYDSDGHVAISNVNMSARPPATAVMNVYRSGMFRVEVRNVGVLNNAFTLTTN
jgi:hypothetical protein